MGGRTRARVKTPSPERPLKQVKAIGIGRRNKADEFNQKGPNGAGKAKAKVPVGENHGHKQLRPT